MAITISGTNGIVGAGFTVDNSGVSVTAGVGTFSSVQGSGANLTALPAANLTGSLPAISAASLTSIPAANIVGVCTAGLTRTGGFGGGKILQVSQNILLHLVFGLFQDQSCQELLPQKIQNRELATRLTDDDKELHKAFVETLGENSIWKKKEQYNTE